MALVMMLSMTGRISAGRGDNGDFDDDKYRFMTNTHISITRISYSNDTMY